MRGSKLLAAVLAVTTAVFILSVSIAVPILLRPVYYVHVDWLELEERTGLERTQILQAYDAVMDFCIGRTRSFSAGVLPWSASGRAHFEDVRGLVLLDLRMAALAGLLLLACGLVGRKSSVQPYRFFGHGSAFWGSVGLGGAGLLAGGLAALDFERAFLLFHTLAFPGKYNWYFDPHTDGIIRILPPVFFQNCAVLILLLIVVQCALCIIFDTYRRRK